MTAPLTVDVTGWLITRLAAALTATVDSETPGDTVGNSSWVPFVRVVRIGGPNDGYILDIPTVAFHCFAASQQAANQLGYTVISTVNALRGAVHDGAVITRTATLSGPSWAAVENQNLRHTVVLMQIRIKTA